MNSTPSNKRLKKLIKDLSLSMVNEIVEESIVQAEKENRGYDEFLCELFEAEVVNRKNNRVQRFLRESKIPLEKSLQTFDMERLSLPLKRVVNSLIDGGFLSRKENVLAFGKPGSGKTHLLCAIAQELIYLGHRIYFTTGTALVEMLLKAKKELKLDNALKKFSKYDAIIIDDIGYVKYNREEMEVLFTLLSQRYERGSIMLTSNLPFSKWEDIFKDSMTTAAAIDRLVHHSVIIELNLNSYRMEVAQKRKNDVKNEVK